VNDYAKLLRASLGWDGECYAISPTPTGYCFMHLGSNRSEFVEGLNSQLETLLTIAAVTELGLVARKRETMWDIYSTHGWYLISENIQIQIQS
jgi:hypothetical protein